MDIANSALDDPSLKGTVFGRIGGDVGCVDDLALVEDFVAKELKFRRLEFETGADNTSKNGAQDVELPRQKNPLLLLRDTRDRFQK